MRGKLFIFVLNSIDYKIAVYLPAIAGTPLKLRVYGGQHNKQGLSPGNRRDSIEAEPPILRISASFCLSPGNRRDSIEARQGQSHRAPAPGLSPGNRRDSIEANTPHQTAAFLFVYLPAIAGTPLKLRLKVALDFRGSFISRQSPGLH